MATTQELIQQRTQKLLSKQAELLKRQQSTQKNYGLPVYKSSKQIKEENFDLRHSKAVTRVLKMHAVMPRMLRKVTEPRKSYAKDYAIDVDKRVREVLEACELERQQRLAEKAGATESAKKSLTVSLMPSEDNEFFGNSAEPQNNQQEEELPRAQSRDLSQVSISQTQRQLISSTNLRSLSGHQPKHSKTSKQTTVVQSSLQMKEKRRRRRAQELLEQPAPRGACVTIDQHASKQIRDIEAGIDPSSSNLKESLAVGLLKQVDRQAMEKVIASRRQLSMLKFSGDEELKQAAKEMFVQAAELQSKTHDMVRVRPTDKVRIIESKAAQVNRRRENIGHGHFVKMSFEQLPVEMQQKILTQSKGQQQSQLGSRHGSVHSISQLSSRIPSRQKGLRPSSSTTRGSFYDHQKSERTIDGRRSMAVKSKFDIPSDTQRNTNRLSGVDDDATTSAGLSVTDKQQDCQRLLQSQMNAIASNNQKSRRANASVFESASMATISEQEDFEATLITNTNERRSHQTGKQGTHRKHKTTVQQPISFVDSKMLQKKNESLFHVRKKHARNGSHMTDIAGQMHPYSSQIADAVKCRMSSQSQRTSHQQRRQFLQSYQGLEETKRRGTRFGTGRRGSASSKQPDQGSISNLPLKTVERMTKHLRSNRSQLQSSGISPMRYDVQVDELMEEMPKALGDNLYLVRSKFHYQKPKKYKIEFARPAIFCNGCLTCGNEHAKVENYGERYCCVTCQKSLQTPSGESVTLRASHDGRFIVAQAQRYSRPVKGLKVDIDDLRIRGGHKCHATFAGEKGDIIVLLDEVNETFVHI